MPVQINTLEVENVKRIKAVALDCSGQALTVIGGKNGQGKTSVLDAIAFVLGGGKYSPSALVREGSLATPEIRVTMNNGLIVERKGKNATLKVIDPRGAVGGQKLLDSFVSELAINLPKFLTATSKEKAKTLLQIIGIETELARLETEESRLYNERTTFGRIADQKRKFADEMQEFPDAPATPISASELIQRQQDILARNGENQRKRQNVARIEAELAEVSRDVARLRRELEAAQSREGVLRADLSIAKKSAEQLHDESTADIEADLRNIEVTNARVRANLDKAKASAEAESCAAQYDAMTAQIEAIRQSKMDLLNGANLPLPGLSVEAGELLYNGKAWDCMAGSEQLRVATAIVRRLNPECGFVLIDKLEQMDLETLRDFGAWLESEGLQAIATRVSTGDECSIIIEDGLVAGQEYTPRPAPLTIEPTTEW